ncbi:hypothetical protein ACJJI4_01265 [Microbulbifer sp. TRSA002]|uniref:DUF7079 family protein n=1 Tax=Microbulbifer sp. TRSA002 TaxID=3243382 RepID=UPI004039C5BA
MKSPEIDIKDRTPIWDCLQALYMDTDVSLSYEYIAKCCGQSKYSLKELEEILFNEVLPALRFNMLDFPAPEWAGFETKWVVERVLKKHRHGERRPWVLRTYTNGHWKKLKPLIEIERAGSA